ncbi:MAG TPA: HAD family hydrolase [Dehalococcoidia bacterium]|nr:HAD family hydrolase [Dehalococcoidia bacterium]
MPDLPRAFFFDLDDTLIDDSGQVDSGWRTAIAELVSSHTELDALLRLVHEVRDWYWSEAERHRIGRADLRGTSTWIVAEALSRLGAPDERLAGLIGNRYRDLREQSQALMPGAIETLEALRAQGVRLALLTNGASAGQRAKIGRFQLEAHFDYISIEGEFGCGKPDERVYRAALAALESEPCDTWMVGDNLEWDVEAPMRLGITGIWFDRHAAGLPTSATSILFEDGKRQPDRIIRSLTELL